MDSVHPLPFAFTAAHLCNPASWVFRVWQLAYLGSRRPVRWKCIILVAQDFSKTIHLKLLGPRFSTVAPKLELLPCPNTVWQMADEVSTLLCRLRGCLANGAIATGPYRVPYATFRKVVTGNRELTRNRCYRCRSCITASTLAELFAETDRSLLFYLLLV